MLRDFDPILTYVVRNIPKLQDEATILQQMEEFARIKRHYIDDSKPKCKLFTYFRFRTPISSRLISSL